MNETVFCALILHDELELLTDAVSLARHVQGRFLESFYSERIRNVIEQDGDRADPSNR